MTKRAKPPAKAASVEAPAMAEITEAPDLASAFADLAARNPDLVRQMQDAMARGEARPARVEVKQAKDATLGGMELVADSYAEFLGAKLILQDGLASSSPSWRNQMLLDLAKVTGLETVPPGQKLQAMSASLALVAAINPQDELEAALAVQMVGAHVAATDMLQRIGPAQYVEHVQTYGNLAVKLSRTFAAQIEALAKLRGGGTQKVVVHHEHVYVHGNAVIGDGAQAVFGDGKGGGGSLRITPQPHERDGALWSENPAGLALSGPGDFGAPQMPPSRGAQSGRPSGTGEWQLPKRSLHERGQGDAAGDRGPSAPVAGVVEAAMTTSGKTGE